jgi:hypothetical protein
MYESEPFKVLREFMQEQVQAAFEDMIGNVSSDPMTYMRFQLRWQQREAMYRAMMIQADDTIKEFKAEQEQFEKDFAALSREE